MHNNMLDYQSNCTGYGRSRGTCFGYGNNRPRCQLCDKFGHLVHRFFQSLNVHFQGFTAQSPDSMSANLTTVQWHEEEDVPSPGPSGLSLRNLTTNSLPGLLPTPMFPLLFSHTMIFLTYRLFPIFLLWPFLLLLLAYNS